MSTKRTKRDVIPTFSRKTSGAEPPARRSNHRGFIAEQKNKYRELIETLRREYHSHASEVHGIEPRHKLTAFPAGDPAGMEVPELKAMVASAKEMVVDLKELIPQLREQKEAARKAGCSRRKRSRKEWRNWKRTDR